MEEKLERRLLLVRIEEKNSVPHSKSTQHTTLIFGWVPFRKWVKTGKRYRIPLPSRKMATGY